MSNLLALCWKLYRTYSIDDNQKLVKEFKSVKKIFKDHNKNIQIVGRLTNLKKELSGFYLK